MDHEKELYGQGEWGERRDGDGEERGDVEYGAHVWTGGGFAGLMLVGRPWAQHMTHDMGQHTGASRGMG